MLVICFQFILTTKAKNVSDLFTVHFDDKGQTMLVICFQFTLTTKTKQC